MQNNKTLQTTNQFVTLNNDEEGNNVTDHGTQNPQSKEQRLSTKKWVFEIFKYSQKENTQQKSSREVTPTKKDLVVKNKESTKENLIDTSSTNKEMERIEGKKDQSSENLISNDVITNSLLANEWGIKEILDL